jgi:PD-(D/E)XK nuclease superfamily
VRQTLYVFRRSADIRNDWRTTLKALGGIEEAQAIDYLRASGLQRALLINFGARSLQYRRVVVDLPSSVDPRPKKLVTRDERCGSSRK